MDLPPYYVPPASDISTPTREDIIKGGFLTGRILKIVKPLLALNVLAAPAGMLAKGGRWALPAGELLFAMEGLAFITQGKRIGTVEQYLGGSLFWVFKNVGGKFAESVVGKAVGEEIVSALAGTNEWMERVESLHEYAEGIENPKSLFLPINRVVSLSLSLEPKNMYGITQLDLVIEGDPGTFTEYNFLAREEDGNIFSGLIPFIYFLRLNYEQRCFQTSLFRRYANPSFEMPQKTADWSTATVSFKPDFYQHAGAALKPDAPTVGSIQLEALAKSRNVISELRSTKNPLYNLDTPSGKLFDVAMPQV
ncbi:MAG: hypothetical protein JSR99_03460 [Proteobacteria bacterium]|nr:hypothetical protein [Pseudomonadota bacterium]